MQAQRLPIDPIDTDSTPNPAPRLVEDRRAESREPLDERVRVSNPTPDPRRAGDPYDSREVADVNVSGRGVGFVSDRPLAPGTYHRIELPGVLSHAGPEVRVRHCTPTADGYVVGGELR